MAAVTAIGLEIAIAIEAAEIEVGAADVVAIRHLALVHAPDQSTSRQRSRQPSKRLSLLVPLKRSEVVKNLADGLELRVSVY